MGIIMERGQPPHIIYPGPDPHTPLIDMASTRTIPYSLLASSTTLILLCLSLPSALSLTPDEQTAALQPHNSFRQSLAQGRVLNSNASPLPPGRNIYSLTYDPGLEQIAQAWADKCQFTHSPAQVRNNSGENLYYTTAQLGAGKVLPDAAQAWWKEIGDLGWSGDTSSMLFTLQQCNAGLGHWTQMAWDSTTRLGCGVRYCPGKFTLVVCNYSPAGNILNRRVYEPGAPCREDAECTSYPSSTCNATANLCSVV